MNLERTVSVILAAQKTISRKEKELHRAKEVLARKIRVLAEECKPVCARAIQEYNTKVSLKIVAEETSFDFFRKKELHLLVWMKDAGGREPDEEFDSDIEVKEMERRLRPILELELRQANIPFRFGGLHVPHQYYMK